MKNLFLALRASLLLLALNTARPASAAPPDTAAVAPHLERPWYLPRHLLLQTGGGLGMATIGAGYVYAKGKMETDLLLGYVPKKYAGTALSVFALKVLYSPFRVPLAEKWQLLPVTVGAYYSHTHNTINDGFKGQYAQDYYWFSHDNRYGPLLGSRLTYLGPPVGSTGQPRKMSFYYEFGTNDLYLLSYFTNPENLGFGKLLTLTLGLKADF